MTQEILADYQFRFDGIVNSPKDLSEKMETLSRLGLEVLRETKKVSP